LDKKETFGDIVRAAYPELKKEVQEKVIEDTTVDETSTLKSAITHSDKGAREEEIIIDNDKQLHCVFCPECDPQI